MPNNDENSGYAKLLEHWESSGDGGDPVCCIATTYTFDEAFFEQECLSRFLDLETDANEFGREFVVELVEKLGQAKVTVLVDRQHTGTVRSLYWDLLPIHVPNACMHAKITVLMWSNAVRLIVASSNITEPGYRSNLEVFGCLEFRPMSDAPLAQLHKALDFIESILAWSPAGKAQKRAYESLALVRQKVRGWKSARSRRGEIAVHFVPGGRIPGNQISVLETLRKNVWPTNRPPQKLCVVSPFFDDDATKVAKELKNTLTRRSERSIEFDVSAMKDIDGSWLVQAPKSLHSALPSASFVPVLLEEDQATRRLHAKCVWIENEQAVVYMIGSSNCTCAGLGIKNHPWNLEANLAYVTKAYSKGEDELNTSFPEVADKAIENLRRVRWQPLRDPEDFPIQDLPPLPSAFADASFVSTEGQDMLQLTFNPQLPKRWKVMTHDGQIRLYDATRWRADGSIDKVGVPWREAAPPSVLRVIWEKDARWHSAVWVVNSEDPNMLPLPQELRALDLESLVEILSMSKPLYQALKDQQRRIEKRGKKGNALPELDPHRRVSEKVETFLLQRTRRYARALEALQVRLEYPCASLKSLEWRLTGPVSPMALARAVMNNREGPASADERAFLLSELALTLSRVKYGPQPGCVSSKEVVRQLRNCILEIKHLAHPAIAAASGEVTAYARRAFEEGLK